MNTESEVVSIIVPVYNVDKYLSNCVESLINQTYSQIEIILVNDGSTDTSPAICKRYADQDKRIHMITQDNKGLSSARNSGISESCGKWIIFVDSDDALRSDAIEELVLAAKRFDADIVCGGYSNNKNDILKLDYRKPSIDGFRIASIEDLHYSRIKNHAWGKLFASNLLKNYDIRFPKGRRYEDIATTYRLFEIAKRIVSTNDQIYWYRVQGDSIASNPSERDIEDMKTTFSEISFYYRNNRTDSSLVFQATVLYELVRIATLCETPICISGSIKKYIKDNLSNEMVLAAMKHIKMPMSVKIICLKIGIAPLLVKIRNS